MKISRVLPLAVLALSSTLAMAQPAPGKPPNAPGDGPPSPLLRCLAIVQLTDAQKTQIRAIFETARPELEVLHQQLAADRQALKAALGAVPLDNCAIGAALVKVQTAEAAIRTRLEAVRAAVSALLTPEQRARLEGCLEAPKDDRPNSAD